MRPYSLSIKSFLREYGISRGSAHKIDFATQNHKNREHVSRFLYSKREKVSEWELSDVRVLRSQNTDCRKNDSFSTGSKGAPKCALRLSKEKDGYVTGAFRPHRQAPDEC